MDDGGAPRRDRAHAWILAAIVVWGAVVRVLLVGVPMRYDEAFNFVAYAKQSVGAITNSYTLPNNHILHTLAVHLSWRAFGDHVWAVRLPALLAGIAIVPAVYSVGRALYSRAAGLWAAGLAAGFAPLVDYSINARGYTLGVLLVLVALRLATLLLDAPRPWAWPALAVCFALAFYTVPTLAYGVGVVVAWMGAVAIVRRDARTLLGLGLALAFAAGLDLLLYSAVLGQPGWTASQPLSRSAAWLADQIWTEWNRADPHPLDWLVSAGFLASLLVHRRIARHPVPLAVAVVPVVAGILLFTPASRLTRSWLPFLPLYLIHAGAGLSYLLDRVAARIQRPTLASALAATLVAAVLGASVLHTGEHGAGQPPTSDNRIVDFLRAEVRPHEAAVLDGDVAVASSYYLSRSSYVPPGLPPRRRPVTALVVVARDGGPRLVNLAVAKFGWHLDPAGPAPALVKRFEYVEAWRARID